LEAAVTDETDAFANTAFDSAYRGLQSDRPPGGVTQSTKMPSDELVIMVPKSELSKGLGLELSQAEFRTNMRVFVKSVAPESMAGRLGIKKDYVVVSINGKSAERTTAEGVVIMLSQAAKATSANGSIEFRFRDPSGFQKGLNDLTSTGEVTTQVAPAGDTTQRYLDGRIKPGRVEMEQKDQRLKVTQLVPPKMCRRGATTDDLLEISYLGTVVETGETFDGSAIKINGEGIPGRGNDVSLYFVKGKQPFGQFPPSWDVGLEGMCVGERRRLIIPPVLAYGATGVPGRRIPPNATLQYDITLVSINGLATPQ
jgi:FK506-binding protein 2